MPHSAGRRVEASHRGRSRDGDPHRRDARALVRLDFRRRV